MCCLAFAAWKTQDIPCDGNGILVRWESLCPSTAALDRSSGEWIFCDYFFQRFCSCSLFRLVPSLSPRKLQLPRPQLMRQRRVRPPRSCSLPSPICSRRSTHSTRTSGRPPLGSETIRTPISGRSAGMPIQFCHRFLQRRMPLRTRSPQGCQCCEISRRFMTCFCASPLWAGCLLRHRRARLSIRQWPSSTTHAARWEIVCRWLPPPGRSRCRTCRQRSGRYRQRPHWRLLQQRLPSRKRSVRHGRSLHQSPHRLQFLHLLPSKNQEERLRLRANAARLLPSNECRSLQN